MAPLAHRYERLVARDVGRGIAPLAEAATRGLERAAEELRAARAATLLTGFYIPRAVPPGAETDGPIGAAFVARSLVERGVAVRVVTDAPCAPVVAAALAAHGLADRAALDVASVDGFSVGEPLAELVARHQADPPSHVVAIERCGPAADGRPYNMRGEDVGPHTAPLEQLFVPPAYRIGVGDGGNELGMGTLPPGLIAAHVAHGERVACTVPADAHVVAGVSNWGAAALALLVGGRGATAHVNGAAHDVLLDAICAAGAVDGVTRSPDRSVDNIAAEEHRAMIDALVAEQDA